MYNWTVRFFKLWSRNQWKRERYAPGFHLDQHNLDSRSWTRFPILNGGYTYELEKLKEYFEGNQQRKRRGIGF
jgi:NAD+ synthase (glutamine-hydrolysing)